MARACRFPALLVAVMMACCASAQAVGAPAAAAGSAVDVLLRGDEPHGSERVLLQNKPGKPKDAKPKEPDAFFKRLEKFAKKPAAAAPKRLLLQNKPGKPKDAKPKEPDAFFKRLEKFAKKPATPTPKRRMLHAA